MPCTSLAVRPGAKSLVTGSSRTVHSTQCEDEFHTTGHACPDHFKSESWHGFPILLRITCAMQWRHLCHAQFTFWILPDQPPGKRRAEAPTTTAHEWHGRYSILKHAPQNIKHQSCAKRKRAQLIQNEKKKRIMIMMVIQATS